MERQHATLLRVLLVTYMCMIFVYHVVKMDACNADADICVYHSIEALISNSGLHLL